ncbi:MAG: hypothetical protein IJT88_08250 [Kiritimatiellae bacterium]|nr:hypothetical protein [Kiritimatiellia bacterium]
MSLFPLRQPVSAIGAATLTLALLPLLGAGCLRFGVDRLPLAPEPAPQAEVDAFIESGRDARVANITVYRGTTGKPVFQNANRPWYGKSALVRFFGPGKSSLPIVRAESARMEEYGLLLDPTARQNWCRYESAPDQDYRPFKEDPDGEPIGEYPDHVVSDIPGYAGVANKVVFETLHVESPVYYVPPAYGLLGPLARPEAAPAPERSWLVRRAMEGARKRITAVMGASLMQAFSFIRISFPERTAILATSQTYRSGSQEVLHLPMTMVRERPSVVARIDGSMQNCWIDLAGDFALSVPAGVPELAGAAERGTAMLDLGGYVLDEVPVVTHESLGLPPEAPPRIGWRLWREYTVVLDFKQSTLWLEDNSFDAAAAEQAAKAAAEAEGESAPLHYRGITP